jgi:osmotically-inducible protein OsmY
MITLTKKPKRKRSTQSVSTKRRAREAIELHSHFRGRIDSFQFEHRGGVLTVRGRVPSFYLRQVLERALKRVDGVRSVDNQVDVVCCGKLSSVRNDRALSES